MPTSSLLPLSTVPLAREAATVLLLGSNGTEHYSSDSDQSKPTNPEESGFVEVGWDIDGVAHLRHGLQDQDGQRHEDAQCHHQHSAWHRNHGVFFARAMKISTSRQGTINSNRRICSSAHLPTGPALRPRSASSLEPARAASGAGPETSAMNNLEQCDGLEPDTATGVTAMFTKKKEAGAPARLHEQMVAAGHRRCLPPPAARRRGSRYREWQPVMCLSCPTALSAPSRICLPRDEPSR